MTKRYCLKVYLPYNTDFELLVLQSDFPFTSFQSGNLLNLKTFSNIAELPNVPVMLKIIGVEHAIAESDEDLQHTIHLYTEEVMDNADARLGINGHIER